MALKKIPVLIQNFEKFIVIPGKKFSIEETVSSVDSLLIEWIPLSTWDKAASINYFKLDELLHAKNNSLFVSWFDPIVNILDKNWKPISVLIDSILIEN